MEDLVDFGVPPGYVEVFSRAPVYDLIFSSLSPRSLFHTAWTCRVAHRAVAEFKIRAFNINRHLSRYFTDPLAFRSLQASTNTLLSGSSALQFLDRTFYPESDLDLYTHPGHSFEVARFLVEREGYHYVPRGNQDDDWKEAIKEEWNGTAKRMIQGTSRLYPQTGIEGVWTFKKTVVDSSMVIDSRMDEREDGENQGGGDGDEDSQGESEPEKEGELKVQIIEASGSPVEVILEFHSTCVMNFITVDAAYSMYPVATFEDRRSLGMPSARTSSPKTTLKYVRRGWRIYYEATPRDLANPMDPPFMLDEPRWVGDRDTWVLPLDKTGVKERPPLSVASAPLTIDPVLYNGWKLMRCERGDGYYCHSHYLQTTIFRYNYVLPDEEVLRQLRKWANVQAQSSFLNLTRKDWVWFDGDIPSFLPRRF